MEEGPQGTAKDWELWSKEWRKPLIVIGEGPYHGWTSCNAIEQRSYDLSRAVLVRVLI